MIAPNISVHSDFYGILPELQYTCLLTRCVIGKKKNIYFVTPAVKNIVNNNQTKIKVMCIDL